MPRKTNPHQNSFAMLAVLAILALGLSVFIGRYPAPYWMSPRLLATDTLARDLVLNLRLPRLLAAFAIGAALAASGLVMQMLFRNPLVEPGFLGVSQGAAFGAAFSMLFLSKSPLWVQASATLFAMLGLALTYFIAERLRYGGWILRMILSGIAVSAMFAAGVGLLKTLADPLTQLPEIVFWLLGGLWGTRWENFLPVLLVITISLILLTLARWRLNILSLEEETAFSLGASPGLERSLLLFFAVAATAASVSLAGMIGWVGLIIPHIARRFFGSDTRYALPASILMGGVFTLVTDDLARTASAGEIPLGILTSLLGAIIFIVLLSTQKLGERK